MSFLQYDKQNFSIPIKKTPQEKKSLYVPLTSDTFMILKINSQYQVYSIRNAQLLYRGQIPKQFYASQYMSPIVNYKEKHVFFFNNQGSICKLKYRDNTSEMRKQIMTEKNNKPGSFSVQYRVIDKNGEYILGWVQNIQKMSCTIFLYDWVDNTYSNSLNLGSIFFNLFISNMSLILENSYHNSMNKLPEINFLVISEDQKKTYYNPLSLEAQPNNSEISNKTKRYTFVLKQVGRKFISIQNFPKVAFFNEQMLYLFTNSKEGPKLIILSMDDNNYVILPISFKNSPPKQKGIIKKNFGIVDDFLMFSIHFITLNQEEVFAVPVKQIKNINSYTKSLQVFPLAEDVQLVKNEGKNHQLSYLKSIDGCSFHKNQFKYEKISKLCIKENENFQSMLTINITYGVPKKFFYQQIAQELQLSSKLTHEILELL